MPQHQPRVELGQQEDTGHPGAHAQARRDPDGEVERGSRCPREGERRDEVFVEGLRRDGLRVVLREVERVVQQRKVETPGQGQG